MTNAPTSLIDGEVGAFAFVPTMPPAFDQNTYRQTHPRTEEMRRYKTKYPQKVKTAKRRTGRRKRVRSDTFVAIDGEGWNYDERHEYTMIVTSDPDRYLSLGRPLMGLECLAFLADLPKKPRQRFVSFFFDYDVTMILRDMAMERPDLAHKLFAEDSGRKYVWWKGFGIKYRPHKSFTVKRWRDDKSSKATVIHDVGTFFQSTFMTALKKFEIGDEALWSRMGAMKDARGTFTSDQADEVLRYSQEECVCLVQLAERIRDFSAKAGLSPSPYEGPGGLANNALTIHYGKDRHNATMANMSEHHKAIAFEAMYGGRFETLAVGKVATHVTEWDLSSAYPSAMLELPCLVHGRWVQTRSRHEKWALSFIEFWHDDERSGIAYPLPVRSTVGGLFYPRTGAGWYWRHEYDIDDPQWHYKAWHTWSWRPAGCDCKPFEWIRKLYEQRKEMETEHPGSGIALKLALNTLYGKTAQRNPVPGAWLNMTYASMITSLTRRKMYDLYRSLPERSVVMFATDAIFTVQGELETAEGLGGLERAHDYDSIVIVQPGVYFSEEAAHFKTRGIPKKIFSAFADKIRAFAIVGVPYPFEVTVFHGLRLCLHRGAYDEIGQWSKVTRTVEPRPTTKRYGEETIGPVTWTYPRINKLTDGRSLPMREPLARDLLSRPMGGPLLSEPAFGRFLDGLLHDDEYGELEE